MVQRTPPVSSGYSQYDMDSLSRHFLNVQDIQKRLGGMWAIGVGGENSRRTCLPSVPACIAHVGEIERGKANVTIQTLKTIADTLDIRIVDLALI
jgi:hypothetical protein